MKKSCRACKHAEKFKRDKDDLRLLICGAENPEQEDEGLYILREVSKFDASKCLMFIDVGMWKETWGNGR